MVKRLTAITIDGSNAYVDLLQSREVLMSGGWSSLADRRADGHGSASRDSRMVTALFTVMVLVAVLATLFGIVGLAGIVGHQA